MGELLLFLLVCASISKRRLLSEWVGGGRKGSEVKVRDVWWMVTGIGSVFVQVRVIYCLFTLAAREVCLLCMSLHWWSSIYIERYFNGASSSTDPWLTDGWNDLFSK